MRTSGPGPEGGDTQGNSITAAAGDGAVTSGGTSSAFEGAWNGTLDCTLNFSGSEGSGTESGPAGLSLSFDENGSMVDTFGSSSSKSLTGEGQVIQYRLTNGILTTLTVTTRQVSDTEVSYDFTTVGDETSASPSGSSSTHFETRTVYTMTRSPTDPNRATIQYAQATQSTATVSSAAGTAISDSSETLNCTGQMSR